MTYIPVVDDGKVHITEKDMEVIILLAEGFTDPEIGEKLCLSSSTIKGRVNVLKLKLSARNRAQLISQAYHLGLLRGKSV